MPVESDHRHWVRKLDGNMHIVPIQPTLRLYPTSLAEVIECVETALNPPLGAIPQARAIGSHWGISHAGVTAGYMIETAQPVHETDSDQSKERLNEILYNVVPSCLTEEARSFFKRQPVPPFNPTVMPTHSEIYLFHVEAGMRIHELYSLIDAGDVGTGKESLGDLMRREDAIGDYSGPWALQSMGGAGGQTIAGAFSTGTHGGDVLHGPLADSVLAVHLIDAQGKQHWIERTQLRPTAIPLRLIEEAKLQQVFPKIECHRDDDLLNAVVVACGRMGVIYSAVLRVVRQFALEEQTRKESWSSVKTWLNGAPIFGANRFVSININPYGTLLNPKDRDCYVITRVLRELDAAGPGKPLGRAERAGANAGNRPSLGKGDGVFANPCASDNIVRDAFNEYKDLLIDTRDAAIKTWLLCTAAILFPLTPAPVRALAIAARTIAADVIVTTTAQILLVEFIIEVVLPDTITFGDTLADVVNFLAHNGLFPILHFLFGEVYDSQHEYDPEYPRSPAISYAAMDQHDYLNVGCVAPGDSIEIFFDAMSPKLQQFIDLVLERVRQLEFGELQGADVEAFGGYISLRFMSESQAPIAMQRWPRTCSIEIAGLSRVNGTEPLLRQVETDAVAFGAILHWGQRNNWKMKEVEAVYGPAGPSGPLFKWRAALSRLTEHGRYPLFSTAFSKQVGLEITTPIIQEFSAKPTEACADEHTVVSWQALSNPPETQVSLSIVPENGSPRVIALPALAGSQNVTLGPGRSKLTLILLRELGGNVYTDQRELHVRGFAQGDPWTFTFDAQPRVIDGVTRWTVEINLFSQFISDQLRVAELRIAFSGVAAWTVRNAEAGDVQFTGAASQRVLPTHPVFNRNWLIFSNSPSSTGPSPTVQIVFVLICEH